MEVDYDYKEDKFIIKNFNRSTPFHNFLPGISGMFGIPMWVFYTNRGQVITSFGIGNKDNAILEFRPADQAINVVSSFGFRTFIKIDEIIYEPFQQNTLNSHYLEISPHKLKIVEINEILNLSVEIEYCTMDSNDFPGLIRKVKIINKGEINRDIEILDGLPKIIPYGMNTFTTKSMSYTSQAWMEIKNLSNKIPFFKVKADMADTQNVDEINSGNFYLSLDLNGKLDPIVDPNLIFKHDKSFHHPISFIETSISDIIKQDQRIVNYFPSAFFGKSIKLNSSKEYVFYNMIGNVHNLEYLNDVINNISVSELENQFTLNKNTISNILSNFKLRTSNKLLDKYGQLSYLDNILRGGMPKVFDSPNSLPNVYHMFFRKHGDMERDYNDFYLSPEYYSQGNANYRDINQNRRLDVLINPKISYYNIITFVNLLQIDGYNPLVLTGVSFKLIKNKEFILNQLLNSYEYFDDLLKHPYTPGKIVKAIRDRDVQLKIDLEQFISLLIANSNQIQNSSHGEGFWVDHFGYNLDLVKNYLLVYPDKRSELLFHINEFKYLQTTHQILPFHKRLGINNGQLVLTKSLVELDLDYASNKINYLSTKSTNEIFKTNLFIKLLSLTLIKFTTQDPYGYGLEMEAGKPGWYDALNGLPSLFGSSSVELFELLNLITFLNETIADYPIGNLEIPTEIHNLISDVISIVKMPHSSNRWAESIKSREKFQNDTLYGFEKIISISKVKVENVLIEMHKSLETSINSMIDFSSGYIPTYFYFEIKNQDKFIKSNEIIMEPVDYNEIQFTIKQMPLFLEGYVKGLTHVRNKLNIHYTKLMSSDLYDTKLKMFKVNAPLSQLNHKIGRTYAFTPGWLENESIWLHMEYKLLLTLLKLELYDQFYTHFKNTFIPFLSTDIYGRSVLENSSFIVSSAYPDDRLHGRGFYARLSGATIEALNILAIMFIGHNPYSYSNNELSIKLKPTIPGWLFDENNEIEFLLHGYTQITYVNNSRFDTHKLQIQKIIINDIEYEHFEIREPFSKNIREQIPHSVKIILN